ncbi:MAG TPA: hypothetical protein VFE51_19400 [Verrucomicrobiae bacterium]|nr:hypothetical protein [Verrucomicrobiae bacterium]
MNGTAIQLVQPLAYRVWEPTRKAFFYSDVRPQAPALVDRWAGLFDKQCTPLFENDIIRVHYDWKYGWVRAVILRDEQRGVFFAQARTADGTPLRIGFYCFAEAYRVGNLREHPRRLVAATEQFAAEQRSPWWLSPTVLGSAPGACYN